MLGCSGLHVRLVSWHESAVPWRGRCVAGDRCRKEGQGSRSAGAGRVTKGRCWRGCPSAPTHLQRASRGGKRVSKGLRLPLLRKSGRLRQNTQGVLGTNLLPLQKPHKRKSSHYPRYPKLWDRCEKDTCSLQLKVELPTAANAPHETRRVLRSYRTRRQDATATAAEPREDAVARSYCLRLYLRLAAIAC